MNYHELQKATVVKLREMAKAYPELEGVSGMHKDQLVDALAHKLGIEIPHRVATGIDKTTIKKEIRALKKVRDEAVAAKDHPKAHDTRRKIHHLQHKLRRAVRVG